MHFSGQVVCQGLADDTAQAFKEFCSKLVIPAFNHVGWDAWQREAFSFPAQVSILSPANSEGSSKSARTECHLDAVGLLRWSSLMLQ